MDNIVTKFLCVLKETMTDIKKSIYNVNITTFSKEYSYQMNRACDNIQNSIDPVIHSIHDYKSMFCNKQTDTP